MKGIMTTAALVAFWLVLFISITGAATHSASNGSMFNGDGADILGDTVTIGTTWIETQHSGTIGRMVEKDEYGYIHFAWMNALDSWGTNRHIYYNWMDSLGLQGWPGVGYQVESSERAGYVTLDVAWDGRAFPAFHQRYASYDYHTAVGVDFFPHAGAFLTYEPNWLWVHGEDVPALWPNIRISSGGLIHVVATIQLSLNDPLCHVYTVGVYDPVTYTINFPAAPDTWQEVGHTDCDGADVATSEISERMAIAWINLHHDLKVLIDDDGQYLNFDEAFNLTQFIPRDTLRAHNDLSLFFDDQEFLHVAFTTQDHGLNYVNASIIWHWSEQFPTEFSVVANAWDPEDEVNCGGGNLKAQRPSLGQDPESGYLYCMYQMYDTDSTALSAAGWPSGEVYVSVSTDEGLNWSVGTNVTETITPQGAPPGECLSEECPSMATLVDGECHIMYVFDREAGFIVTTLNPVKYHGVPVDLIPTTPLVPPLPFHVEPPPPRETNVVQRLPQIVMNQPVPNPFNPVTIFSFELRAASFVKLEVFDIAGRSIRAQHAAPLHEGWMEAGHHEITFDGSRLASGIYIYRLQAGEFTASGKMVLMK